MGIGTEAGSDAKIFVCTVGGFPTVENTWTITGKKDLGNITAVSATDIVGLVPGTTYAYRMDVTDGSVVWTATLPANIFGSGQYPDFIPFWDGVKLWFACGNAIYSMDVSDGSVTKLTDTDAAYNVCIANGIAFTNGKTQYRYAVS